MVDTRLNDDFIRFYGQDGIAGWEIRQSSGIGSPVYAFGYTFDIRVLGENEDELEVIITSENPSHLRQRVVDIESGKAFERPGMLPIVQQKEKYSDYLDSPRFEQGQKGEYYFRAKFRTADNRERLLAVSNFALKPLFLEFYLDRREERLRAS